MRIAGIIKNSVVNGIGIRDVIFLQGCYHHCEGCHNPETWDIYKGKYMDIMYLYNEIKDSPNNLTISGGEPLLQIDELIDLLKLITHTSDKTIWLYTGFTFETMPDRWKWELSQYVDVLVDGKFEIDKKDLTLQFRGSSNQRLIDLKESVKKNKVKLWEDK